jgi:site-specific DNA-adenine methylase
MSKIKKIKPFIINYVGVKYTESINYFENETVDFSKYDVYIEPFGGSFGFSRYIYVKYGCPTNKKFIICDNDEKLINFYKNVQNMNLEEYKKLFEDYNNLLEQYTKEEYKTIGNNIIKMFNEQITNVNVKFMITKNIKILNFIRKNKKSFDMDWFNMLKYCEFYFIDMTTQPEIKYLQYII